MAGFYSFVNKFKTYFKEDLGYKTVTTGDIFSVDLEKQTMFPLAHIMVNSATTTDSTIDYNVSVLFMDLIDECKLEVTDLFEGNDNTLDVINSQFVLASKFGAELSRGKLYNDLFQLFGTPSFEFFVDRFENKLGGTTMTFDVVTSNNSSICDGVEEC